MDGVIYHGDDVLPGVGDFFAFLQVFSYPPTPLLSVSLLLVPHPPYLLIIENQEEVHISDE